MTTDRTIPDFHDALVCEALITLRKLTEAARVQAQAIEAQAAMVERLLDGAKRYAGASARLSAEDVQEAIRKGIISHNDALKASFTREGRRVEPVSPLDEPKLAPAPTFAEKVETIRQDIASLGDEFAKEPESPEFNQPVSPVKVEIVEKEIPQAEPDTVLDASGKLIHVEPEHPPIAIRDVLVEQEERLAQKPADEVSGGDEEALLPADPKPEADLGVEQIPSVAIKPRAQPKPAVSAAPVEKTRDRILNRYEETGMGYVELAVDMGLNSSTVATYLSEARSNTDRRVAAGDLKRTERENTEEIQAREALRQEGLAKCDLVFFEDDLIGSPAYVVNYAEKRIETPNGDVPLSPAWLRIMDVLKDRDDHPCQEVWEKAGRFSNERQVLTKLCDINLQLAQAKLYILAEAKHYQICGLL